MSAPPRHGVIKTTTWKTAHAKAHLSKMVSSANDVRDYGSHGDIGQSSQGGFTGSGMTGGASNASYSTSSADSVGDADSGGPNSD